MIPTPRNHVLVMRLKRPSHGEAKVVGCRVVELLQLRHCQRWSRMAARREIYTKGQYGDA